MSADGPRPDEAADVDETAVDIEPEDADTEGHSLLNVELGRNIATNRAREVAEWGRSEQARKQAEAAKKQRST